MFALAFITFMFCLSVCFYFRLFVLFTTKKINCLGISGVIFNGVFITFIMLLLFFGDRLRFIIRGEACELSYYFCLLLDLKTFVTLILKYLESDWLLVMLYVGVILIGDFVGMLVLWWEMKSPVLLLLQCSSPMNIWACFYSGENG